MKKLEVQYFKKFFNRNPTKADQFVMPIMQKVYRFEFKLWAKGYVNFNANSKKHRPGTMRFITREIMKLIDL